MYIKNISKKFGEKLILDNISYDFAENKITFIMGKSGCGKTTLLNILMGLVKADSGELDIAFDGKISAVFQENRLCSRLNAVANIKMVCDKNVLEKDIINALLFVLIDRESIFKPTSELSGGMMRRVAIVRAFLAESDIVILDEAFKGIDSDTMIKVAEFVRKNQKNRTVIAVTHNPSEIEMLDATTAEIFY